MGQAQHARAKHVCEEQRRCMPTIEVSFMGVNNLLAFRFRIGFVF